MFITRKIGSSSGVGSPPVSAHHPVPVELPVALSCRPTHRSWLYPPGPEGGRLQPAADSKSLPGQPSVGLGFVEAGGEEALNNAVIARRSGPSLRSG